jgi:hypothetical protein
VLYAERCCKRMLLTWNQQQRMEVRASDELITNEHSLLDSECIVGRSMDSDRPQLCSCSQSNLPFHVCTLLSTSRDQLTNSIHTRTPQQCIPPSPSTQAYSPPSPNPTPSPSTNQHPNPSQRRSPPTSKNATGSGPAQTAYALPIPNMNAPTTTDFSLQIACIATCINGMRPATSPWWWYDQGIELQRSSVTRFAT